MYTTLRGVKTEKLPYGQIPPLMRETILEDYWQMGSAWTRKKYNISTATLHHIRWHNADLDNEKKSIAIGMVKISKDLGKTTQETAILSGIPLEQVNKLWPLTDEINI